MPHTWKLSGPLYPVVGVYFTMFWAPIEDNCPCLVSSIMLKVIGLLSGSLPDKVIPVAVSVPVVILFESAVGGPLAGRLVAGPITKASNLPSELGTTAGSLLSLKVPLRDVHVEDHVLLLGEDCVL